MSYLLYSIADLRAILHMIFNLPCFRSLSQSEKIRDISLRLGRRHSTTRLCKGSLKAKMDRECLHFHGLSNLVRADRLHLHLWVIGQGWMPRRVLERSVTALILKLKVL